MRLVSVAAAVVCLCYHVVQSSVDSCGTYSAKMDQDLYPKHKLTSSVVASSSITRPLECYSKCLKNCLCVSFNVCNGGEKCELNSGRKDSNISLYESSDECDYYEYDYSGQVYIWAFSLSVFHLNRSFDYTIIYSTTAKDKPSMMISFIFFSNFKYTDTIWNLCWQLLLVFTTMFKRR